MKAKDTVMSPEQIMDIEEQVEDAVFSGQETPSKSYLIAKRQAEISFKAGIRGVVEWGMETCPHDLFGEGTHCFKRACDECWQSKIKEWGIE